MAGRPRKPTPLAVIEGGLRAEDRRERADEPRPPARAPRAPAYLSKTEKAAWERFAASAVKLKVLCEEDWAALEQLACAFATSQELREVIRREGRTYETIRAKNGRKVIRPRPELAMLKDANKDVLNLLGRFGLTPSDRSKVRAGGTQPGSGEGTQAGGDPDGEFT